MTLAALALSLVMTASAVDAPQAAAPTESSRASRAADACKPQKAAKTAKLTFPHRKTIVADIVDTPASRETGLMCRTHLAPNYGMLFVFPAEMDLNFWMKNTLVNLDIIWIGADKKITVIHANMKKSRTDTPDSEVATAGGRGMYVLELPAGAAKRDKLKAGDQLKFDVEIPRL